MSTNDTKPVVITHKDAVTELILNRPDKLNALNADMAELLLQGLDEAVAKNSQLVIVRGAGRAFSAGFDLSGLDAETDADLLYRFVRIETLLQTIYTAPMPCLALVHGRCFGAGADLVAVCTHRIAAPDTSFRMPGLQFGIVLGTRRLSALIGPDAARDILQTSRVFDCDHALACGFLTSIAAVDEWPQLLDTATSKAKILDDISRRAWLKNCRDDSKLDSDMAELVLSASRPGLVSRVKTYIASLKKP